ncbi:phosphatase PAP2 family protein [bacterium]|nr:phosphatase PAP2 family protein [bacterium]
MWDTIGNWDLSLYRYINLQLTSPAWDPFMVFVSKEAVAAWLFGAAILIALGLRRRYALKVLAALGFVFLVSDALCTNILKPTFHRVRPCHHQFDARRMDGICGSTFGMPSNHAASTAAMATVLAVFAPWPVAAVAFLAVLVTSYSRVYLGVHYPGDVLAGIAVGIALGALVSRLLRSQIRGSLK